MRFYEAKDCATAEARFGNYVFDNHIYPGLEVPARILVTIFSHKDGSAVERAPLNLTFSLLSFRRAAR